VGAVTQRASLVASRRSTAIQRCDWRKEQLEIPTINVPVIHIFVCLSMFLQPVPPFGDDVVLRINRRPKLGVTTSKVPKN
jgi:hypothetical protein